MRSSTRERPSTRQPNPNANRERRTNQNSVTNSTRGGQSTRERGSTRATGTRASTRERSSTRATGTRRANTASSTRRQSTRQEPRASVVQEMTLTDELNQRAKIQAGLGGLATKPRPSIRKKSTRPVSTRPTSTRKSTRPQPEKKNKIFKEDAFRKKPKERKFKIHYDALDPDTKPSRTKVYGEVREQKRVIAPVNVFAMLFLVLFIFMIAFGLLRSGEDRVVKNDTSNQHEIVKPSTSTNTGILRGTDGGK